MLVVGRLLPALVGRAGADQVHVGPEVLAVLAGAVAGAVGTEAEILRRELLGGRLQLREKVAPLIAYTSFDRIGLGGCPEFPPVREVFDGCCRLDSNKGAVNRIEVPFPF